MKYTLQESTDLFTYKDIKEIDNDLSVNIRTIYKLPKDTGKYYYRIKGEYQGKIAYSEIITIETKGYFGEIGDFTINGEEPVKVYIGQEDDYMIVEFEQKSVSSTNITYISRLSKNQETWILASSFNSKNKVEINDNKCKQYLYLSGMELKLYYYLEVNMENSISQTEIYEIYVIPQIIFFDDFIDYLKEESGSLIEKLNMFNE